MSTYGVVTIWNVRSDEEKDEEFLADSERAWQVCGDVGWRYHVFAGMAAVQRTNLMWLDGYRRSMPWYESGLWPSARRCQPAARSARCSRWTRVRIVRVDRPDIGQVVARTGALAPVICTESDVAQHTSAVGVLPILFA